MLVQTSAADHDAKGEDPQSKREKCKRTPEEVVRSLQTPRARPSALRAFTCVKAQEAGRYNKVKALQYLLTRSQSARTLAVERVTENDGRKTAGVDGAGECA